jgi:shikimate kinase
MAGIIPIAAPLEMRIISLHVSLVLIGYRGSGKTTVGRLLATRLGKKFLDADEVIIATSGKSIREIFAAGGEPEFRRLEIQAIADIAKNPDHIIAVGGGAITKTENQKALAAHKIIYLHCEPAELRRRITRDPATSRRRHRGNRSASSPARADL